MADKKKSSGGLTTSVIRAPGKPWRLFFVRHGISFVNIPATGNSWRRRAIGGSDQDKAPYRHREEYVNKPIVAFVRHPVARFVGVWRSKYHSLGFDQIMDRMHSAKREDLDGHLMPQHRFLDDLPEPIFLGKFERLFGDWDRFREGHPEFPPLDRRLDLLGQPYTHLVLDHDQEMEVAEFYHQDMVAFSYAL